MAESKKKKDTKKTTAKKAVVKKVAVKKVTSSAKAKPAAKKTAPLRLTRSTRCALVRSNGGIEPPPAGE